MKRIRIGLMGMKNTILLCCVLILLLTGGCAKDGSIELDKPTVQGFVRESGTNIPIPYATVYLGRKGKDKLFGTALGIQSCKTTKTDEKGFYKMSYDTDDDYSYGVDATKEGYRHSVQFLFLNKKHANQDIYLNAWATVKFHLRNVPPAGATDLISFSEASLQGGYPELSGTDVDTTFLIQMPGNQENTIGWDVRINDQWKHSFKQVYCSSHDTTLVEIEY